MTDTILKLGVLLAIFASIFIVSQLLLNTVWSRRSHIRAINKRLSLIRAGGSREEIMERLRKNAPTDFNHLPPIIARWMQSLQRTVLASALPITVGQTLLFMAVGFVLLLAVLCLLIVSLGYSLQSGILLLATALSFCAAFLLPVMVLSSIAQRRRKRVEQQFPVSLDVFVRSLRAGHPVASAIDLLTNEMEDPIGSEYGLVADEVSYGAELTDALSGMADRWDLDDIRMFVVSLSVQSETGGNLAETLENLSEVIRARASLYMKVRALSSEGRMTGWMLTILPIVTFLGLFAVNPSFYLDVAQDSAFIIGFITLALMYLLGFVMIRKMVNIKV